MQQTWRIEPFDESWATEELVALLGDYDELFDEWECEDYELDMLKEARTKLIRLINRRKYEVSARSVISRLVQARQNAGFTQTEAAIRLGYSNASTLSQIEGTLRDTEPKLSLLFAMCDIYGVSLMWVLTGYNPGGEQDIRRLIESADKVISDVNELKLHLESLKGTGE